MRTFIELMDGYKEKPTQEQRVLKALVDAQGKWVSGRFFLQDMLLSQYHARIFGLQKKGYVVEASDDRDRYGFKFYRISPNTQPIKLL